MTLAVTGLLAPAFATGWLFAAVCCVAAAGAVFGYFRRRLQPPLPHAAARPGALRADSPAVVNLLTNDAAVTAAALRATVIDLAARGWLRILPADGHGDELARVRPAATAYVGDTLLPHERLVLQLVMARHSGGDAVPARFLAVDTRGSWWRRFADSVAGEARDSQLIDRRWAPHALLSVAGLTALGALCCLLGWANGDTEIAVVDSALTRIVSWAVMGTIIALAVLVTRLWLRPEWTHTADGLAAAERWLAVRRRLTESGFADLAPSAIELGDRRLAYASAMCLADRAREELPLAREDHRRVWSTAGGPPRLVRVRYPAWPGYGINPWFALGGGVAAWLVGTWLRRWSTDVAHGAAFTWLYDELPQFDWLIRDVATLATLAAYVPIIGGLWLAVVGAADALNSVERTGFVIRSRRPADVSPLPRRMRRWLRNDHFSTYIALDDGTATSVVAWKANERNAAPQGARATIRATPLLGYVRRTTPVGHRPIE